MSGPTLKLRRAAEEDCRLLWQWANDPTVRARAFSAEPIAWEDHVNWFSVRLDDPSCYIFIAAAQAGDPVGQVRFDVHDEDEAVIDVSVDESKRGLGYGSELIRAGVDEMFRVSPIRMVRALVKKENASSARAFEKAGFQNHGIETVGGVAVYRYTRVRNSYDG